MAAMTAGFEMMGTRGNGSGNARTLRNLELFELQRKARRGPTPEVFFAKHIDNSRIVKADDPERRREMRLFSLVMSALFALVMVYVWQHLSSIEMGYQVESQKQLVEHLREENRQIRLTEAQLTEPQRIDIMARELGMNAPEPGQVIRTGGFSGAPAEAMAATPGTPAQ